MLAKELKTLANKSGRLIVKVKPGNNPEADTLGDYGHSVSDISTYLKHGMTAAIVDAWTFPKLPPIVEAEAYNDRFMSGHIYFIFDHGVFLAENEKVADAGWLNPKPKEGELPKGTAIQIGAYSGFDMIGFPADLDVSDLFDIIAEPVAAVPAA